jgi:deoxyribonucleoside regulator
MENDKKQLAINIARLYYLSEYSQQWIAKKFGISRPSVSRLLKYARDMGYVQIKIADPAEDMGEWEKGLIKKYGLKDVKIANSPLNDEQEIKKSIGIKAADYLDGIVSDGDIIGVGWGTTLHFMSHSLHPKPLMGSQIIQLEGGVALSNGDSFANEILERFSKNFSTISQHLPLPVIFDTREVKEMVYQDRHIKRVLKLGQHANIAIFSVGTVRPSALFFSLGYTNAQENERIQSNSVGDICSRFYDEHGHISNEDIDSRTVGIELTDLCHKEYSILLAGGSAKIQSMKAALAGHYANVLITDQFTAEALLNDDT